MDENEVGPPSRRSPRIPWEMQLCSPFMQPFDSACFMVRNEDDFSVGNIVSGNGWWRRCCGEEAEDREIAASHRLRRRRWSGGHGGKFLFLTCTFEVGRWRVANYLGSMFNMGSRWYGQNKENGGGVERCTILQYHPCARTAGHRFAHRLLPQVIV